MFEILLSYAILLEVGLISDTEYKEYLNELFLQHSDNDLLLELEWESFDREQTVKIILNHCFENGFNYYIFGCFLFSKLEETYYRNDMDIRCFSSKAYSIWRLLPSNIQNKEPFWTLNYADDPLSWGDEQQTRELYQKAFQYYNYNKF